MIILHGQDSTHDQHADDLQHDRDDHHIYTAADRRQESHVSGRDHEENRRNHGRQHTQDEAR